MKNSKFIVYNKTKNFNDDEVFAFISSCMQEGLLSNNGTEYCYCVVRPYEEFNLVCLFSKNKNNYRIDIYEEYRESEDN